MPAEVFFTPVHEAAALTGAELKDGLRAASLPAKGAVWERTLWIEFDGYQSRLLLSKEDTRQALITLQVYGDLIHETSLIEKLETVLQELGYVGQ